MNTNKKLAAFLLKGRKTVNYLPWLYLPPVALLFAVIFTYAQQSRTFWEALQNQRFLTAVAWSFLPALIIVFYIQSLCYVLDLKFYRHTELWKRIQKQVLLGILVPGFFLASYYIVYYGLYGKNIFKRKYFQVEFPMSFFAVGMANFLFFSYHQSVKYNRQNIQFKQNLRDNNLERTALLTENIRQRKQLSLLGQEASVGNIYPKQIMINNGEEASWITVKNIICVLRWEKIGVILLETGEVIQMDDTLGYILSVLDEHLFAKSNRWCIIHLKHVTHTVYESENYSRICYSPEAKQLLALLKPQLDKILKKYGRGTFLTTDKYKLNRNFKKNFEKRLEDLRKEWVS